MSRKITLAFVMDDGSPWLVSSYDEYTFDEWGRVPDYHREAIAKQGPNAEIRECIVEVDDAAIHALFDAPTIPASPVLPTAPAEGNET